MGLQCLIRVSTWGPTIRLATYLTSYAYGRSGRVCSEAEPAIGRLREAARAKAFVTAGRARQYMVVEQKIPLQLEQNGQMTQFTLCNKSFSLNHLTKYLHVCEF